ncbi:hypothetical protein PYW07_012799 [Mythimna separata]|uniref:Reverse transcriptase domain-containing protein n=1 Tax=Mythimna separata TaxID=271217 RepID=A0AAD7Y929_MYTSE|nr:hypothetical protein PYW07_012799 [Mythimna separata]
MYADDIVLVNQNKAHLERKVNIWKDTLENGGQGLNVAKNEYMSCGSTDANIIRIGSDLITKSDTLRYLGSVLHKSGNVDDNVQARIGAAWAKWREVTGVLRDRKMPLKLKGQIYKCIIRPVLLYGGDC